jgi:hypothetical protein
VIVAAEILPVNTRQQATAARNSFLSIGMFMVNPPFSKVNCACSSRFYQKI